MVDKDGSGDLDMKEIGNLKMWLGCNTKTRALLNKLDDLIANQKLQKMTREQLKACFEAEDIKLGTLEALEEEIKQVVSRQAQMDLMLYLDFDGSGNLDKSEVENLMMALGSDDTNDRTAPQLRGFVADVSEYMETHDKDGSGNLDKAELVKWLKECNMDEAQMQALSERLAEIDTDRKQRSEMVPDMVMKALDANDSKTQDSQELRDLTMALSNVEILQKISVEMTEYMKQHDTDKDGQLNAEEFKQWLTDCKMSTHQLFALEEQVHIIVSERKAYEKADNSMKTFVFDLLDADKSGGLDQTELSELMLLLSRRAELMQFVEGTKDFLQTYDTDQSEGSKGVVDKDEFKAWVEGLNLDLKQMSLIENDINKLVAYKNMSPEERDAYDKEKARTPVVMESEPARICGMECVVS